MSQVPCSHGHLANAARVTYPAVLQWVCDFIHMAPWATSCDGVPAAYFQAVLCSD